MSEALCIALLAAAVVHILPTDSVTLRWTHSVERTPWEEDLVIEGAALRVREARVTTSGAGMDPPPDAVWSGGWWRYRPTVAALPEVVLANSDFADGYTLCWRETACVPLETFVAKGTHAKLAAVPCAAGQARD